MYPQFANYWPIISAVCAAGGLLTSALNAYQNVRIELKVELLRNDLLAKEITPLKERVMALEVEVQNLKTQHA